MSLRTIAVAETQFSAFLFLACQSKTAYGSQEQKVDASGVPLWSVTLVATHSDGVETLKVTIPADGAVADRLLALAPATSVEVAGLRCGAYARGKFAEFYFLADEIRPVVVGLPQLPMRNAGK